MRSHEVAGGLSKGLLDAVAAPRNAGAFLIQQVDEGVKREAEIHSPSALFARRGRAMSEGLAEGLESGASRVSSASASVVPTPDTSGLRGGAAGFNAGGVTFNFEINVPGGSQSSASEIVDELQARAPNILMSALEQLAIQGGVA
jgi:hypothetical protein